MLADPTQRFLTDLATAKEAREASSMLAQYSRGLPMSRVAFDDDVARPTVPVDGLGEPLGEEMGWPTEFVRRWVENGFMLACPLVSPCRKLRHPFTWGLEEDNLGVEEEELPQPFTAVGQQTLSMLRQLGVRSGVTVPVHQPGGRTGFVSWTSEEPLSVTKRFVATNRSDLFLVAHAFLERLDALKHDHLGEPGDPCPLTERERECLTWVARGKTDSEIGIIIDRSPETARFHVRNAIAKLDASSRSHAVAKAMYRDWLGEIG